MEPLLKPLVPLVMPMEPLVKPLVPMVMPIFFFFYILRLVSSINVGGMFACCEPADNVKVVITYISLLKIY